MSILRRYGTGLKLVQNGRELIVDPDWFAGAPLVFDGLAMGDTLKWDGARWVNAHGGEGGNPPDWDITQTYAPGAEVTYAGSTWKNEGGEIAPGGAAPAVGMGNPWTFTGSAEGDGPDPSGQPTGSVLYVNAGAFAFGGLAQIGAIPQPPGALSLHVDKVLTVVDNGGGSYAMDWRPQSLPAGTVAVSGSNVEGDLVTVNSAGGWDRLPGGAGHSGEVLTMHNVGGGHYQPQWRPYTGVNVVGSPVAGDMIVRAVGGASWGIIGPGAPNEVLTATDIGGGILFPLWLPPADPNYTFAGLPAFPNEGARAFVTDGRKLGEGAAAGTGVPVYFSNGAWRTYSNDAAVTI